MQRRMKTVTPSLFLSNCALHFSSLVRSRVIDKWESSHLVCHLVQFRVPWFPMFVFFFKNPYYEAQKDRLVNMALEDFFFWTAWLLNMDAFTKNMMSDQTGRNNRKRHVYKHPEMSGYWSQNHSFYHRCPRWGCGQSRKQRQQSWWWE